ncbi:MAG TPA: glycosyltransferase [Planctomycetota bacterium]
MPRGGAGARVLVLIPAHQEAANIAAVAAGALRHAPVLVVDDASGDGTAEAAAAVAGVQVLRHATNTHIARAVLDGMAWALENRFAAVVTMDAGFSHDPEELPAFLWAPAADLVLGVRRADRLSGVPWHRRSLSRAGTALLNRALDGRGRDGPARLADCTSGYRRYSRRAMELLLADPPPSRAHGFLLESLAAVDRAGMAIREVPIRYAFTGSSLDFAAVGDALRAWWRLWRSRGQPLFRR